MSGCTAPKYGHRTASGAANCPACGGRNRHYGGNGSYSTPTYSSSYSSNSGGEGGGRATSGTSRPRWSKSGSAVAYSPAEVRTLTPIRDSIEKRATVPDLRDVLLCHAWDDRKEAAKELHDSLESKNLTVWFSEKDVVLGSSLLREIDKGLAKSRFGIALVTPAFLDRVQIEGIADKELSALLARDLLVPIVNNTTYESLCEVSPLLGSRSGLTTVEDSIDEIAAKKAELVAVES